MIYKSEDVTQSGDYTVLDVSSFPDYSSSKAIRLKAVLIQNEAGGTQKFILKVGTQRVLAIHTSASSQGLDRNMETLVFPPDTDFVIDSSTADTYSYSIEYEYL